MSQQQQETAQPDGDRGNDAPDDSTEQEQPDAPEAKDKDQADDQPDEDRDDQWDPDRARRKIRKLNSEAENLRKRLEEAPKADDVDSLRKQLDEANTNNLRLTVGAELGLPLKVAKRLQGSSREELIKDAEELLEDFGPVKEPPSSKPRQRLRGGSDPDQPPEERDLAKLGERMFRR